MMHIRELEDAMLVIMIDMCSTASFGTETFFSFDALSRKTGIGRDYVRAICRSLTDQGLCWYLNTLFSEDGMVAGSGYGLTRKGIERARDLVDERDGNEAAA